MASGASKGLKQDSKGSGSGVCGSSLGNEHVVGLASRKGRESWLAAHKTASLGLCSIALSPHNGDAVVFF